ncbi:hypothetical protein CIK05_09010 [Bdellovibrio sp. qaytius]|nr:hypothetical protein CIK05_09010 [Bdellovibrio sp. qaytius]
MSDTVFTVFTGGIAVFFAASLVYVILLVFLPEWVGVTGKVALDAEKAHAKGSEVKETGFGKHLN